MASSLDDIKGHLAIFGATGNTGLQLVEQALLRQYKVTALVRNPEKLTKLEHKHLKVSSTKQC